MNAKLRGCVHSTAWRSRPTMAPDVQSLLNVTLETMLGEMTLNTAWISLKADNGLLGQLR